MDNSIKQVIVVRKDLHMRAGKMAAQCCHASLSAILSNSQFKTDSIIIPKFNHGILEEWFNTGTTKIVVSVNSEQELLDIYNKAYQSVGFSSIITDAGRTEFHGVPTKTCIALGPDKASIIDAFTGNLSLI